MLLRKRLEEEGYTGHPINWGHVKFSGMNSPDAIKLCSNKKLALYKMNSDGVPTPKLFSYHEAISHFSQNDTPLIGRTSYHTRGSGFFFCNDKQDVQRAHNSGATHYLEFIEEPREFRVHIVNGKSIKISEKNKQYVQSTGEFEKGSWTYPERFMRKISLRTIAVKAVESLELDFGAVDILYKKIDGEPRFFVLEVNTAPALTNSIENDTLERYVKAFIEEYGQ